MAAVIRVDAIWLATEPLDMRAGTETALARVVAVFGSARRTTPIALQTGRANRMKVLVHDGIGVWLAARRLNRGKFVWADALRGPTSRSTVSSGRRWCWACLAACGRGRRDLGVVAPDNPARRQYRRCEPAAYCGHEYRIPGSPRRTATARVGRTPDGRGGRA
ncbi:putative transposase [Bordetella holmesii 35009]|nr:putative transposase [Bordetella holmesii 35009]